MKDHPATSDIVIVGGGVIGLSLAHALARQGVAVTVLERGECGREASWAGAGVLKSGSWRRDDPLARLRRASLSAYPDFVADLQEQTGIDPEYLACGSLELLLDESQVRRAHTEVESAERFTREYGRSVTEVLSPQAARELEPSLAEDGLAVKYCPVTSQVRNPRLLTALKSACARAGVCLMEHCPVLGLMQAGKRVRGVRTATGRLEAGHVVVAAGSWSSLLDERLESAAPVYPVRGQIVMLRSPERPLSRIVERGRCYIVPRLDGRILVGATEEHDAGYDKRNTADGIRGLLDLAQRLVPDLGQATVIQAWSGFRPGTPDRRPYLGPVPGIDNLSVATGHFRSGLILAPITAQVMSDLILHGHTSHDLTGMNPGREIRKSKPRPAHDLGDA